MVFSLEDVLCEVHAGDTSEQGLPPGFRFHPSDEELITFYLASKVFNGSFCGVEIAEIDLNRCEPWELPDVAKMGEREWYFFSQRDRKYPTGLRTNRATVAGYWKATGKDKEVYCSSNGTLLGMKKTLVFYRGRAPRGVKTKWVMHEYRLEGDFSSLSHMCNEEWVLCRILQKSGLEKKSPLFSSPSPFQPPTLESNPASLSEALQNPYAFPFPFPSNNFQPCFSPTTIINSNPTVPKQPKTEGNFSEFQPFGANFNCLDRVQVQQNLLQDPLSFELDCNTIFGFSAETVHELSTSVGIDKTGFQTMLDLPIIR